MGKTNDIGAGERRCAAAGGVREKKKTRKRQEGESVERAVGHIIKGIRLSEYFRDTIKRLLYGDRELSALFVFLRYSLFCLSTYSTTIHHPRSTTLPGAERPGNQLHSHPVPPSSIPCNVARSYRCNLPVRTQYHLHPHAILCTRIWCPTAFFAVSSISSSCPGSWGTPCLSLYNASGPSVSLRILLFSSCSLPFVSNCFFPTS